MSVKARALEALIGAVPGAAAGAAGGRLTYAPETPQFWLGEGGRVHGRSLTPTEKKERQRRAAVGAALGALAGAGAAVGGGRAHERLLRRYDASDAATVAEHYLAPLRRVAEEENRRVKFVPLIGRYSAEKAERSRQLLSELSGAAEQAVAEARGNRAKRVFNGPLNVVDAQGRVVGPDPQNTARGVIHERFKRLGMDPRDPASYRRALEKRAFVLEFEKTAGPIPSLGVSIAKKFSGTIAKAAPAMRPPSIVPRAPQITSLGSSVTRTASLKPIAGISPGGAAKKAATAAPSVKP